MYVVKYVQFNVDVIMQVQVPQPLVPMHSTGSWLHQFKVPDRFSAKTMEGIAKGVISKALWVEVVASIATQMLQYTMTPTQEVCYLMCS